MLWNSYFSTASDPSLFVLSSYDFRLVAVSVLLAVALSVVGLHIVDVAQKFEDALQRRLAVLSGSLALGIGVWAMHFVGMLALNLCAVVTYDLTITLLSVLPGLIASWVALNLLVSTEVRNQQLVVSGVLVGAGIGGMHYMGMQAMEMTPLLRFNPLWFGLSILVAVALAILALWVRYAKPLQNLASWQRLGLSGTVMGCAISGMHYAAMRAAIFIGTSETASPIAPEATGTLTVAIAAGTISLGLSILGLNLFVRYREMAQVATKAQAELSALVSALKSSEKSLEDRVFERTGELLELNRQLEVSQGDQVSTRMALERSHADLKRATTMLEQTGTIAKVGGWEVDLQSMKLTWTQETFRIAEIEPPVEPPLEEGINLFAPEVRSVISAAVQAAIGSGTPYDLELQLLVANGRRKWVRTQGFGEIRDGKVVRIYGTFQDIAERKATETALFDQQQLHNAELEGRVAQRTGELSAALERLEKTQSELTRSERLSGLGAMVAGVSHELNTPIGNSLVVASTLQDLTMEFSVALTKGMTRSALAGFVAEVQKGTDLLMGSLRRAVELVSSFKQVAVDQVSENRRNFVLQQMVDEILVTLGPAIRKTPHTVKNGIPPDIHLQSYPGPFGQVLTNLVNNALIHGLQDSLHGSITLRADALREGWVQFSVQDDGAGIAPEHLNRVFDPFFTTRLGQGGSGLGLNIVHNIVTQVLGGTIRVESTRGQGARFIIELPLSAPESRQAPGT